MKWMIYGANGYTSKIALESVQQLGLTPIVAGRNKQAISELAEQYNLEGRSFDLSSPSIASKMLEDVDLVINCAGPFSKTFIPMIEACIASKTHYTDITGEIGVFEMAHKLDARAKEAGIVIMPGVGFDIIPTDCLASSLKQKMPDASHLELGFSGGKQLSQGTAKSSVEAMGRGMLIREEGKLKRVMRDFDAKSIDYGRGKAQMSTVIPWGDVYTAYVSTGIPNVRVYIPGKVTAAQAWIYRLIRPVFKLGFVQNKMKAKIDATVTGPDLEAREAGGDTFVWGKVENASGRVIEARFRTPNGYTLTGEGILYTAGFFKDYQGPGGYFTPSLLFGADAVFNFSGVSEIEYWEQ